MFVTTDEVRRISLNIFSFWRVFLFKNLDKKTVRILIIKTNANFKKYHYI